MSTQVKTVRVCEHGNLARKCEECELIQTKKDIANAAYEAGWATAANWMERDDLIADIGSPAYLADREKALEEAK